MQPSTTHIKPVEMLSIVLLVASGLFLISLQQKLTWIVLWGCGVWSLLFWGKEARSYLPLLYISIAILAFTHISTEVTNANIILMSGLLGTALVIPHLIVRHIYKDRETLKFRWWNNWSLRRIGYVVFSGLLAYLILPWYLRDTWSYLNWSVELTPDFITRLFIGTNGLGIWDELFFCSTVLAVFRKFLPFWVANILQAILFTSFLYELGFRGWYGPIIIYIFAWLQGIVFQRTDSLSFIIAIHLTVDAVLFLTLIHLHHPEVLDIFVT